MSEQIRHVLTLQCPEGMGIVNAVTGFLLKHERTIVELKQFDDMAAGRLYLRVDFAGEGQADLLEQMRAEFAEVAQQFEMDWQLRERGEKTKVLIMVSKFDHCLNDLLFRARTGELPIEIVAVVSNHPDSRSLVEWHGIPYYHVPISKETKPQAEAELLSLIAKHEAELVVLARYMQVLSDELSRELTGKTINIHHSFLPSFKGAKPYHQAWERGVKTVGATAHYVNSELDEGPIIAQQVVEVDHTFGPQDLVAAGRDTECKALSNAVRWHCEGRVFLYGNRTVILR
ncbi:MULTISPECIES: formyltetrahydrofolate deformylase [Glutamicibacter]|uniref:Formyltetrahydrofolate deformylase n=2 Tax=Glutamicibacter TaxID=1742989 RepID=A0ABQ0RQ08_GLUNI|nr:MULTISPECIES: formyltetrahydrofolate deformylase [Glutamicibacter]KWR71785.1 formyltetrahydrofolate deformylase [Arthrobacter sp. W1]MDV2981532.1 formyltetrahydrofolate deformylase [Actinomycetes bacterium ARC8]RWZ84984.1 formyltetrahydrofolate deformylase [Glutamicibacter sp. HZAU]UTM46297.1 formyltetrahydrofolate deformylase [Glutamicibacter mysorens]GEC13906.1 formyltetrahydrofolate deformylase [Glutamicibacter nicotianae]